MLFGSRQSASIHRNLLRNEFPAPAFSRQVGYLSNHESLDQRRRSPQRGLLLQREPQSAGFRAHRLIRPTRSSIPAADSKRVLGGCTQEQSSMHTLKRLVPWRLRGSQRASAPHLRVACLDGRCSMAWKFVFARQQKRSGLCIC